MSAGGNFGTHLSGEGIQHLFGSSYRIDGYLKAILQAKNTYLRDAVMGAANAEKALKDLDDLSRRLEGLVQEFSPVEVDG